MMLTACGAESERIEGYSKGTDDDLTKPFSFTELGLRIEALLRRSRPQPELLYKKSAILRIDEMIVWRKNQQVRYANASTSLTPIQCQLLLVLVEHHQQVLTKPYLYQVILKRSYSRYDRSVDMHLSRIRKKLVSAGMPPERLMTVHGKGYQFI
ncbi:MAG: two-component system response regulator PfeR [Candidatus Endobugula sp.]|jgi:two-component system response regulator PfeR